MTGSEAKTFRTLVETAILLLMTFTTAHEAGVVESRVRWGKDGVGLVEESFSSVSSFLGFLGSQVCDSFLIGGGNRRGRDW